VPPRQVPATGAEPGKQPCLHVVSLNERAGTDLPQVASLEQFSERDGGEWPREQVSLADFAGAQFMVVLAVAIVQGGGLTLLTGP
jgi:hypothetical protein